MPVVKLRRPRQSRTVGFQGANYQFLVDVPVKVSEELARACDETKDRLGKVFDVVYSHPDSDLTELLGVQLEWNSWPSQLR